MNRTFFGMMVLLLIATGTDRGAATPLSDALSFWEPPQAFLCSATGNPFPSKYAAGDPNKCDDGDMTLFNGLLCAAGDGRGCDAVRRAQGADGRWWRSPRRIGWTYPTYDVSFSPDQALGVMLYTTSTRDVSGFDRWVQWMKDHRPCIVEVGGSCFKKGWLRYCDDDIPDKRCTFRPGDCTYVKAAGDYLGSKYANVCDDVLDELTVGAPFPKSAILSVPDQVLGSATANTPGFPLHLAAVALLLGRKLGINDLKLDAAGQTILSKQNKNPFFQYLAKVSAASVTDQLLLLCPSSTAPSGNRSQWAWERDQADMAWKDSMYWDCIFLGKML
jgi:hypothetical protein